MHLKTFVKIILINEVASKEISREDYPKIQEYKKALNSHAHSCFCILDKNKIRSSNQSIYNKLKEALTELSVSFTENVVCIGPLKYQREIEIPQSTLPEINVNIIKLERPLDKAKEELVVGIFALRNKGLSVKDIADKFGYSYQHIRLILNGKMPFAQKAIKKNGLSINSANSCLTHTNSTKSII